MQTWAGVKGMLLPTARNTTSWTHPYSGITDLEGSFQTILYGGISLLPGQGITDTDSSGSGTVTGDAAYAWAIAHLPSAMISGFAKLPKYALVPRK